MPIGAKHYENRDAQGNYTSQVVYDCLKLSGDRYFQDHNWLNLLNTDDKARLIQAAVALGPNLSVQRDQVTKAITAITDTQFVNGNWQYLQWNLGNDPTNVLQAVRNYSGNLFTAAADIWSGDRIPRMVVALFASVVFKEHAYIEGPSGTAKSDVTKWISRSMGLPWVRIDASSGKGEFELLGAEVPTTQNGVMTFQYSFSGALTPGALVIHLDEVPRLLAGASNAMLQLLAEGEVALNLTASGLGNRIVSFLGTVIGTGNPVVGYAGQGERNMAAFDRFVLGEHSALPDTDDYVQMLDRAQKGGFEAEPFGTPPAFTFRQARTALNFIQIPPALLEKLVFASYCISPDSYLERWGKWKDDKGNFVDPRWSTYVTDLQQQDPKRLRHIQSLRTRSAEVLLEGSNPRGLLGVQRLARILTVVPVGGMPGFDVTGPIVGKAFYMGNAARLKPLPGCENDVLALLKEITMLFFPGTDLT